MESHYALLDTSTSTPDEMAAEARKRTASQRDAELLDAILGIEEAR